MEIIKGQWFPEVREKVRRIDGAQRILGGSETILYEPVVVDTWPYIFIATTRMHSIQSEP